MTDEEMSQTEGDERRAYEGPTYGIQVLGPDRQEIPAVVCPRCGDHPVYVTGEVPTLLVQNPLSVRATISVYHYDLPADLEGEPERIVEPGEVVEVSPADLGPSDGELPFAGPITVVLHPVESEEFAEIQMNAGSALAELYRALGHQSPDEGADQAIEELVSRGPLQINLGYMSEEAYEEALAEVPFGEDFEITMVMTMTTIANNMGELPPHRSERRSFLARILGN